MELPFSLFYGCGSHGPYSAQMWNFPLIPSAKEVFNKPFLCISGALMPHLLTGCATTPLVAEHLDHRNDDLYPLAVTSHSCSQPLVCLSPWICLFWTWHMNGFTQRVAFCAQLLLPSMMLLLSSVCSMSELHSVYS